MGAVVRQVPADHKWFSRLATAAVLVRALRAIKPQYPAADPAVREQMMTARAELVAELGIEQADAEAGQPSIAALTCASVITWLRSPLS